MRNNRFTLATLLIAYGLLTVNGRAQSAANQAPIVIKNQGYVPFAEPPINYRSAQLDDPVARLDSHLERGETQLRYEPGHGYLRSVLEALHIPVSSQTLVFSKTSFQFQQINPAKPRALYFNDDVYVGQVDHGKFLEFVSFDPRQGAIFYVMDEHATAHPRFERAAVDCVQCHVASPTRGVPGVFLRSVFTRPSGYPAGGTRSYVTGQESPLDERWGGWYVTSVRGTENGMGNWVMKDDKRAEHPPQGSGNLASVTGRLDTTAYLSGSSDVVALLVLAHQTQMHNLITLTGYRARLLLAKAGADATRAGVVPPAIQDDWRKEVEGPAEELVRYLLFANEAPLRGPVVGNTSFAGDFASRGPFDSRGRSLRQFDLRKRLFRYPCSYLIYSESFSSLPAPAKDFVYRRLFEVLSGQDQSPAYASLSAEDRCAVLEILYETKPGLPAEWKALARQALRPAKHAPRAGCETAHLNQQEGRTNE